MAAAPAVGTELGDVVVGAIGVAVVRVVDLLVVGAPVVTVALPVGNAGVVVGTTGVVVSTDAGVVLSVTISEVETDAVLDSQRPHCVSVVLVVSVMTPLVGEVVAVKVGVQTSVGRVKVPLPLPEPP